MPGAGGGGGNATLFRDYDESSGHGPDANPGFIPDATQTQERDTDSPSNRGQAKKEDNSKRKEENSKGGNGKSGWLGGILTKLSLRPPNQMILPDDKNPRIVWDDENKRWTDLDGDGDADVGPPPPPPAAPVALLNTGGPAAAPTANIFKMQKTRHIKKSYVDVFNPSGAPTRPLPPAAEVLGPAPAAPASPPTYFVPAPTLPQYAVAKSLNISHVAVSPRTTSGRTCTTAASGAVYPAVVGAWRELSALKTAFFYLY
ncbi:hypothetical protein EVAR_81129_1 [Eumeta japonica]|uniref:Uncharacterized protein n=1 Tax=Eumeta variegata TaxID=151549 RepID=A0A4C1YWU8_EUMVA|nr:hypothetical protein EVAR_81129_1 [Eumeta japonica]